MKIELSQPVGQIAIQHPEAIPVFEKYKINYFAEGNRSLQEACYLCGTGPEKVMVELREARPAGDGYNQDKDWSQEPIASLIEHIISHHHAYTRGQLDLIQRRLEEIAGLKRTEDPRFRKLQKMFLKMSEELREHMLLEEEVVFPFLLEAENSIRVGRPIPHRFHDYSPQTHPIRILLEDHGMMGREWREMEELADGFQAPGPSESRLRELYAAFRELEKDNQMHMHLENNILFFHAARLGLLDEKNEG